MPRIYLDYNATAPPCDAAREMLSTAAAKGWANPASAHQEGRQARGLLDEARQQVAEMAGVSAASVFFTSGGTEAAHAALQGAAHASPARRVVISGLEHASLRAAAAALREQGRELVTVRPEPSGAMDPQRFVEACLAGETAVAALILAHNETGIVQPVEEVARALGEAGIPLVVDAVQAPGRLACFVPPGEHVLTLLSAHKMGGFPGAGAVIVAPDMPLVPCVAGGEQERRRRGGTPALALIAAMGAAAARLTADAQARWKSVAGLRDRFEERLQPLGVRLLNGPGPRLANTSAFLVPGLAGEDVVAAMDMEGIAISSGSACSTGSSRPSESLQAMGFTGKEAQGLVRVSMGPATIWQELATTSDKLEQVLRRMRHPMMAAQS